MQSWFLLCGCFVTDAADCVGLLNRDLLIVATRGEFQARHCQRRRPSPTCKLFARPSAHPQFREVSNRSNAAVLTSVVGKQVSRCGSRSESALETF